MADGDQSDLSSNAQAMQPDLASEVAPNTTQDSSAIIMSIPPNSSGSDSPDMTRDNLLSPISASHPLPTRPESVEPPAATTASLPQSATPVTTSAPRTRGGFEVDDDEDIEDNEEGKDDVDVYDPETGFDVDGSTPALDQTALDRTSQSPEQENGTTPLPVQIPGGPGASSSALPAAEGLYNPAEAATPSVADNQVQATPPPAQVNGVLSAPLPKTRLAHDVVGILEDRIKDDPRGDTEAYLELINELKSRNKQDEVRSIYEQYLKVFPLDVSPPLLFLHIQSTDNLSRLINGVRS